MSDKNQRRALGRGLSALLPGSAPAGAPAAKQTQAAPAADKTYFQAPIEEIHPMPDQPRKRFADQELDELAQSIRQHGIIQPLIVRPRREGGFYLIAGERRWRAAQRAGKHDVPVVVQKVAERDAFERALIENLQRADLNPIETALAYQRLLSEFELTQDEVADRVGKDRSSVANSIRLLKLPESVRTMVETGTLSMGHARALLGASSVAQMETMARKVVAETLSVRATEKLVKDTGKPTSGKAAKAKSGKKSASVRDLEERLTRKLGASVRIDDKGKKGGVVSIHYGDLDQLDVILEKLL
jgi:ParB family chromosome partitioning protein